MPFRLLWRNLFRHWLRTLLTVLSVAVALFLLSVLNAIDRGLDASIAEASRTRLWVQSAVSLFVNLPHSYEQKIRSTPGVAEVVRFQWFGGVYQDPSNFFAQFGVDPEKWLASYPEIELVEGTLADMRVAKDRCVIGQDLASKFGWKIGDHVPLIGAIFPRLDGSNWDFTVAAIYRSKSPNIDQSTMFFDFDYLKEGQEAGAVGGPPGVGVFLTAVEPGASPEAVIAAVQETYANGPQCVRVTTEAEFQRQFITMLGVVPAILRAVGGGVLFAIFFAVLNTMLMAARERTRDIGVLKAIGFGDRAIGGLLLLESALVCTFGGGLGILLALAAEAPIWSVVSSTVPGFHLSTVVLLQGLGLALGLGVVAGLLPAWRAVGLRPVVALRSEA
ncbi:MAG: ABC transporter permease [Planctomycetes bacterium]|nr:ABC transporter permease [Planctomycetota bacterium]MCC7399128.1 ABC transporter permease [Planctomycetota bacterium]